MALFVPRKLICPLRMHSNPVGLEIWFLVQPFVYFHTSCVQTAKALAGLRTCTGSPEPSLVAYAISTIISSAGSNIKLHHDRVQPCENGAGFSSKMWERMGFAHFLRNCPFSCQNKGWKFSFWWIIHDFEIISSKWRQMVGTTTCVQATGGWGWIHAISKYFF